MNSGKDLGLLILRVGIGVMIMVHGYPKLVGGIEKWNWLGHQMSYLGINFLPVFWGFMAAVTEFFGGLCLILGFFHRVASLLLAFTMLVATLFHLGKGDGLAGSSHSIELGIVFISLILIGPGKLSLDGKRA